VYCTRCGVELENGLTRCPLCGGADLSENASFVADLPEYEPLPEDLQERRIGRVYRRILVLLSGTAAAVVLITDLLDGAGGIGWSPIAIAGIAAGFLFAILPTFRLRLSLNFALDVAVAGVLLLAIDRLEDGSVDWFVGIALPILGTMLVLLLGVAWAIPRVRGVAKPAVILGAAAVLCVVTDLAIRADAGQALVPGWSLVVVVSVGPAAAFLVLLQHTVLSEIDLRRRFYL